MMNGRRLLEQKYTEMKLTYKNLVNANVDLVDENKMLKEDVEILNKALLDIKEYLEKCIDELGNKDIEDETVLSIINKALGSDKE